MATRSQTFPEGFTPAAIRTFLDAYREEFGLDPNNEQVGVASNLAKEGKTLGQILDHFAQESDQTLPPAPSGAGTPSADLGGETITDPVLTDPDVTNLLAASAAQEAPLGEDPLLAAFRTQLGEEFGLDESQIAALLGDAGLETQETEEFLSEGAVLGMLFGGDAAFTRSLIPELQEQFSKSHAEILALQQNLIAAGYLKPSEDLIPGIYSPEVARGYLRLLRDSGIRERDPVDVLRERMTLRGELDPKIFKQELREQAEHAKVLDRIYRNVWAHQPPPGYLDDKLKMNPTEFEAFETAKESFPESPMGEMRQQEFEASLLSWLQGAQPVQPPPLRPPIEVS